jgi:hypothetical protein
MPADREAVFDLIHDYHRRLEWDTLLRRAYTVDDAAPTVGVTAVCTARWALGGYSFRTRYVTFRRPDLAAITLVSPPPFFATWAASIRHESLPDDDSTVTYTMTFRCRPRWAAWLIEPIARAGFRRETARRLCALAKAVEKRGHE